MTQTDEALVPLYLPQSLYNDGILWLHGRLGASDPEPEAAPEQTAFTKHERIWTTEKLAKIRADRYPAFRRYHQILDFLEQHEGEWFSTKTLDKELGFQVRYPMTGVGLRLSRSYGIPKEDWRVVTPHEYEWGELLELGSYACYRLSPLMAARWREVNV